ncbi:MAG: AraC family transcriptional regulator [Gammaproteobacteria bacterium]
MHASPAVRASADTGADLLPHGASLTRPASLSGELLLVGSGALELAIERRTWLLTARHGLWIPPGMAQRMRARGTVSLCRLPIDPGAGRLGLPERARRFIASALLRELMLRAAAPSAAGGDAYKTGLILNLILEEVSWAADHALLQPSDQRLRRVCEAILENPADRRGLEAWAGYAATPSRTLGRLFHAELGMSYQNWHQLALATSALPRLCAGESVTRVALELGYETPGAFSAMFRRIMRAPPTQYRDTDRPNP